MSKPPNYIIILEINLNKLILRVNEMLELGYIPLGGPSYTTITTDDGEFTNKGMTMQAMWKPT